MDPNTIVNMFSDDIVDILFTNTVNSLRVEMYDNVIKKVNNVYDASSINISSDFYYIGIQNNKLYIEDIESMIVYRLFFPKMDRVLDEEYYFQLSLLNDIKLNYFNFKMILLLKDRLKS